MLKSKVLRAFLALILAFAIGGFYSGYTEANKEIEMLQAELAEYEEKRERIKQELSTIRDKMDQRDALEDEVDLLFVERRELFEKLKKEKAVW